MVPQGHSSRQCDQVFPTLSTLQHRAEKPYSCDQCGKAFRASSHLKVHWRLHTGEKPYHCDECGREFVTLNGLNTHKNIHAREKCLCLDKCEVTCDVAHKGCHTRGKPYRCEECGKVFRALTPLKSHWRLHTGERPYHCDHCGREFVTLSGLNTHKNVHSRMKRGKTTHKWCNTAKKRNLQVCKRVCAGEKRYSCDKGKLKKHRHTQTGEKLYLCNQCGRAFAHARSLKLHHHVHTGEIPHQCDHCGRAFITLSGLRTHENMHNGEKLK